MKLPNVEFIDIFGCAVAMHQLVPCASCASCDPVSAPRAAEISGPMPYSCWMYLSFTLFNESVQIPNQNHNVTVFFFSMGRAKQTTNFFSVAALNALRIIALEMGTVSCCVLAPGCIGRTEFYQRKRETNGWRTRFRVVNKNSVNRLFKLRSLIIASSLRMRTPHTTMRKTEWKKQR